MTKNTQMKKPNRVVLGEGYPAWNYKYSAGSALISEIWLVNILGNTTNLMRVPEKWRTIKADELPKVRLIAEVLE